MFCTNGRHNKLIIVCLLAFLQATANAKIPKGREIADTDIRETVEHQLLMDRFVASHLIDVKCEKGIVVLSGLVDNILAKERATQVTGMVRGVRSVSNMLKVNPVSVSDADMESMIRDALALDPATNKYAVRYSVTDGVVTLTGTVDSWSEKKLTETVVKSVKGVRGITNNMNVSPVTTERTGVEIRSHVKSKLEFNPYVDELFIDVTVNDGNVKLSGFVGSPMEAQEAQRISWVSGVKDVDIDELKIKEALKPAMERKRKYAVKTDEQIKEAITDAFAVDPRLRGYTFTIEVENAIVTLKGVVHDLKSKRTARQTAKNTRGVYAVVNAIKVRPEKTYSDSGLADNIRKALKRDVIIERHDVTVKVRNQCAYLYGTMDAVFEKNHAADVVSRVPGVVDIQNRIVVEDRWTWKDDRQIKDDIESELFWSAYVESSDIAVKVNNGTAVLNGTVDGWAEMESAVDNAFQGGARVVKSRLKVRGPGDHYPTYHFETYYDYKE